MLGLRDVGPNGTSQKLPGTSGATIVAGAPDWSLSVSSELLDADSTATQGLFDQRYLVASII